MGDASLRLLPDFVGRAVIVGLPVGFVGILVGIEILVGLIARQFTGHANGAVRTIGRIGIKNVGAVALQDLLTLPRNIFRHAESDGESLGRAQHGIGDAGVAAGGVEQDLAGTQPTSASSFGDDVGRGTILDRSAGVIPLRS